MSPAILHPIKPEDIPFCRRLLREFLRGDDSLPFFTPRRTVTQKMEKKY
jgi:hypothetical protein